MNIVGRGLADISKDMKHQFLCGNYDSLRNSVQMYKGEGEVVVFSAKLELRSY